jgi:hypothetical protein
MLALDTGQAWGHSTKTYLQGRNLKQNLGRQIEKKEWPKTKGKKSEELTGSFFSILTTCPTG